MQPDFTRYQGSRDSLQNRERFIGASKGSQNPNLPSPLVGSSEELAPEMQLDRGRYTLVKKQEQQTWGEGIYEALWQGRAVEQGGASVAICEVRVPENSAVFQSTILPAIHSLLSIRSILHLSRLIEFFQDRHRSIFIFQSSEGGESLSIRMQRYGVLSEREVLEYCLRIATILEHLAPRSLVHGNIRPEHIIGKPDGYLLTNCSPLMISGTNYFLQNMSSQHASPYMSPELRRGEIDGRVDLYALMATAYHLLAGRPPVSTVGGKVVRARQFNPQLSPQVDALLAQSLHPMASQRPQHPTELREILLNLLPNSEATVQPRTSRRRMPISIVPEPAKSIQENLTTQPDVEVMQVRPEQVFPAPQPEHEEQEALEASPSLAAEHDLRNASYVLAGLLAGLGLLTIVAR
jgi:serine/threonine protein kinase